MEIDKKLRSQIRQQTPTMDKEKKFVFISHNKVAQRSVARDLLRGRVLVRKDDTNTYDTWWKNLTNKELSKMFIFTIIRNPYDRYVSAFFHFQGRLQGDRIVHSPAQIQPMFDIPVAVGNPVNKTGAFIQNALDDAGQGLE